MNPLFTLFLAGIPAPQGSKRIVQPRGARRPRLIEVAKHWKAWRCTIEQQALIEVLTVRQRGRPVLPLDCPVWAAFLFQLRRPVRPRWDVPAVTPDLSKLVRGVEDALVRAGALSNDSRIVQYASPDGQFITRKCYVTRTIDEGCRVYVGEV